LQGKSIHDIYEPYRFNLLIRELPDLQGQQFLENYAVVPPFTLLFYILFTFTGIYKAKFLFNVFSVLVFCFFLLRLLKRLEIHSALVFLLPFLLIIPFRNNLLFGQTYLLLTGFLMGGFLSEEKKKSVVAAIFYSLAIALKISPAILLFYLLARKNFKVFSLVILFSSLFFLSAVYFTGWNFMQEYLFDFIPRMSANEINNPYATTYQSITVLLRNLFKPDLLLHPAAPFNSIFAFNILGGLLTGILFFFFARQLLMTKDHFSLFSFTLLSGCLFTAYTSSYSLIFLLPFCIDVIRNKTKAESPASDFKASRNMLTSRGIFLILVFFICTIPVSAFQSLPLLLRFPRLYLLLILFFIYGSIQKFKKSDLKWLGLSILVFISGSMLISKPADQSNYFLDQEISYISYDFKFNGKELVLKTLDENGPHEKFFALQDSVKTLEDVSLTNNQINFHDLVTTWKDHKRNPVLVNHKEIVYLSDQNRGIGFYALRKIAVQIK